ncbi:MAG TPA: KEOPS complex subunit Pcc1 [Thermoplasmata archaeon]|nr:KEOPS complex subunit Pcc1 [Thermoplasmata archaeon]
MSTDEPAWTATLVVRPASAEHAEALERALRPEAAREVPRARAELDRPDPGTVRLRVEARDTGAMRAALNTYLGWIHLAFATRAAVDRGGPEPATPD